MLIKLILIAAVLISAYYLIRSTANAKSVALRRLLLLIFVIAAVISILFPDITTIVASWVGVGRGTDLILYMLLIAFLSYAVVSFRRLNEFERRITALARELAIAQANPNSDDSGQSPESHQSEG